MIKKTIFKMFKIYKIIAILMLSSFILFYVSAQVFTIKLNTEEDVRNSITRKYGLSKIHFVTTTFYSDNDFKNENEINKKIHVLAEDGNGKEIFIVFSASKYRPSKKIAWPFNNSFKDMILEITKHSDDFYLYQQHITSDVIDLYQKGEKNDYIKKIFDKIPDDVSYILRYGKWMISEFNGQIKVYGPGFTN